MEKSPERTPILQPVANSTETGTATALHMVKRWTRQHRARFKPNS